jgi:hypothetical protein
VQCHDGTEVSSPYINQECCVLTSHVVIPEFTSTSQPELDSLLSKYREEVFVPESLSKAHKRLMYRPTKHHILKTDAGVTVSVTDEVEIKLEPKFIGDRPKKDQTMAELLRLLAQDATPEAWSNLRPFMEGLKTARWSLPSHFLEKLARIANNVGTQRIVIECAEQAATTDARLSDPSFTRELLFGCHDRAIEASFEGEEFERAARQAQRIVLLLNRDEHCGSSSRALQPGHHDMRQSLFVNAVQLEMTASRLLASSSNPTDQLNEVSRGVARVLALCTPASPNQAEFAMPELFIGTPRTNANKRFNSFANSSRQLENLVPVWSGLKFAGKIPNAVRAENKAQFGETLQRVSEEIQKVESEVRQLAGDNLERRSLNILEKVRNVHG